MRFRITFLFLLFTLNIFSQNMFIAHRGASFLAPENTVASAKLAWELGADAVEVDVWLSLDNRVMVIHDKDTKRTCNGRKNLVIKNTPSILLRDLDAGVWKDEKYKGEKIPFLEEIIQTVPENKILVVEIKSGNEIFPALKRCLEKSQKANRIIFIAFDWNTIVEAKKEFPDNKCYWLSSSKSEVKRKMPEIKKADLNGIDIENNIVDSEILGMAKANDLEVFTWTVDDPVEARRLTDLDVTAITTNRPGWLKEEMEEL